MTHRFAGGRRDAGQEGHGANRTGNMWKDEALRAVTQVVKGF